MLSPSPRPSRFIGKGARSKAIEKPPRLYQASRGNSVANIHGRINAFMPPQRVFMGKGPCYKTLASSRTYIIPQKREFVNTPLEYFFALLTQASPRSPRSLPVRVDLQRRGTARTAHTMPNCAAPFTARYAHYMSSTRSRGGANKMSILFNCRLGVKRKTVLATARVARSSLPRSRSLSRASTEQNGHFVQLCISRCACLPTLAAPGARAGLGEELYFGQLLSVFDFTA